MVLDLLNQREPGVFVEVVARLHEVLIESPASGAVNVVPVGVESQVRRGFALPFRIGYLGI